MRIEKIEGLDGLFIMKKAIVFKEIIECSNFFLVKDYSGNIKIFRKKKEKIKRKKAFWKDNIFLACAVHFVIN